MKTEFFISILVFVLSQVCNDEVIYGQHLSRYVNPFIGTANQKTNKVNWKNGETFSGAVVQACMEAEANPHLRFLFILNWLNRVTGKRYLRILLIKYMTTAIG